MPGGQLCLHRSNCTTVNIRGVSAWERCIWIAEPHKQSDLMPILVVSQSINLLCRACPRRDSAWATLERSSPEKDGSILSSHWLSGTAAPLLALAGLQVNITQAISLRMAFAIPTARSHKYCNVGLCSSHILLMSNLSALLQCRQRRLANTPQRLHLSQQSMAHYRPQPCIHALGNPFFP